MDFSIILQLRTKKFWWMDVIFYFVISLLIATVICYLIFLVKNNMQRDDIKKEELALQTVGTSQQKDNEKEAINYRGKINDFAGLLKNRQFGSNVFSFMQAQTMPNIWFQQFNLDEKAASVQLSGQADSMEAFSKQVTDLENNKYIKSIGTLNSSLSPNGSITFNMGLIFDKSIFDYISDVAAGTFSNADQTSQSNPASQPSPSALAAASPTVSPAITGQQSPQPVAGSVSNEKLITSFHIFLNHDIAGIVDETNFTVVLNVPYGTDIKNLTPSIVISPSAKVIPASGVSQDFANPVVYRVTAQDGSVQDYKVRVVVSAQPQTVNQPVQSGYSLWIISSIVILLIVIIAVVVFVFIKKKRQ